MTTANPLEAAPVRRSRASALREAIVGAGIVALGVAIQLPLFDRSVVDLDEGQLAAIGSRLLSGELLYRDIHTGIFPGIYYLAAALFAAFGEDLVVARGAQVCVNVATALCLWRLATRVARPFFAALPPLLYLALVPIGFPVLTILNYSSVAGVFGLAALVCLVRYLESGRVRDAVALAVCLSAAVLVKQNFGALIGLALTVGLLWGRRGSALAERSWGALLGPIVAPGAAVAITALACLAASGTLASWFEATVVQIVQPQLEAYNDPIPPIVGPHPENDGRFFFVYSPPALFNYSMRGEKILGAPISRGFRELAIRFSYGIPLAVLLLTPPLLWFTRKRDPPFDRRVVRAIAVFAGVFFFGIFPSAIWSHLAYVLPPILVLLALLCDRADAGLRRRAPVLARSWRLAWVAVVGIGGLAAARVAGDIQRWHPVPSGVPGIGHHVSEGQAALYRQALRFIDRCAAPGESIFVAPDMPVLYFASQRPNPTPYDLIIAGAVDGGVIVERLDAAGTNCIVYNPAMYIQFESFEAMFPQLHRYLEDAFQQTAVMRGGSKEWHGLTRRSASR